MKKLILTSIFALLLISCGNNTETSTSSDYHNKQWYSGGTLHKSNISDWNNASDENKLATCGDFMGTVDKSISMDELKIRASKLKNCIDESTKGLDEMKSESVSSVASMCIKLIN